MPPPAKRTLLTLVVVALIASTLGTSGFAQSGPTPQGPPPTVEPDEKEAAQPQEQAPKEVETDPPQRERRTDEVVIEAREQDTVGDVTTYTGYVDLA
jgi:hypothetical protein